MHTLHPRIAPFHAGRQGFVEASAAAQACGIRPGLGLPAALALCAGLTVQPRAPGRERRALEDLALWAYQFSAGISFEPALLLLESLAFVVLRWARVDDRPDGAAMSLRPLEHD